MDLSAFLKKQFEDFFDKRSSLDFLYKDKKLLNEGRYGKLADRYIQKVKWIPFILLVILALNSLHGINSLIEYGRNPNWFDLILGISVWILSIVGGFWAAREYYTVKSAMSVLKELAENEETEKPSHLTNNPMFLKQQNNHVCKL